MCASYSAAYRNSTFPWSTNKETRKGLKYDALGQVDTKTVTSTHRMAYLRTDVFNHLPYFNPFHASREAKERKAHAQFLLRLHHSDVIIRARADSLDLKSATSPTLACMEIWSSPSTEHIKAVCDNNIMCRTSKRSINYVCRGSKKCPSPWRWASPFFLIIGWNSIHCTTVRTKRRG